MNWNRLQYCLIFFICSIACTNASGQNIERIYKSNILTPQLFAYGNQQGLPVYILNSGNRLELEFDDLDADVKSYYYCYVLCDYNWNQVNLSPFDYIKGFTQNRITTYRYSSIALTRYTHYQAFLPDNNSLPTKSGNYILKVYLDGDSSKLVFTKQMLVVDPKATISASIAQPLSAQLFNTHQKVRMSINIGSLNTFSAAQQVKVVILQNNRWDIAQRDITPTFVRTNLLEYSAEDRGTVFPGGKEWRWLDLRSFRLQSDRVDHADYKKDRTDIYLMTDIDRSAQRYVYFPDYDGMYNIISYESINPFWQGDYATVHFSFATPNGPLQKKDLYLAGGITGYQLTDQWKMKFNEETGKYENTAFLKQGYYNYTYITVDQDDPSKRTELEGNYWETENTYTILVYYKSFTDRTDQLIGVSSINSRNDRPGFSF